MKVVQIKLSFISRKFQKYSKIIMLILICFVCVLYDSLSGETKKPAYSTEDLSKSQYKSEKIPVYQNRFGRTRPVVAVIGDNYMTELTDYVVPYGVLTRSKSAEVFAVGISLTPISFYPALKIFPQESISSFDKKFSTGADYVIVPAIHHSENPILLEWLNLQASKGATIIGVCDGVWVLANAGLLKGKRATGFWYSLDDLEKKFKDTTWVRNRRYVVDQGIVTTTAVTASIPVSLALVEAIAGKDRAFNVAVELGVQDWSPVHDSNRFRLTMSSVYTVVSNFLSFWSYEKIGIPVMAGVDEIKLALVADAYSRTYRSQAFSIAKSEKTIRTSNGLRLIPDIVFGSTTSLSRILPVFDSTPAVITLDQTLLKIGEIYGRSTADFVALILEYPYF
ncbi:DJ-1/PfpI family protein [Leptospira interrogans]|uniref:Transcriptional regulator n=8 Tax=Leptospira interrogans TaxID=173 RepID=Q8F6C5_LEPIN|nr:MULTISPECIES: DJ-1/PfpI family protein [Leptospira]EMG10591.1 DJ-1/PfpI family protein [Leptospira interrogans serovar Grippotyphosa str. LT2186]EMN29393.1 DJ-1/PfpI family protein [Leptospira interrogans serovar Pyrogenes str. L0374]AAN48582.1 putative transcriptional regulator [Leptospira interrogans serovar Lai str. 56601]AER01909.1 putative transcriptional regulator [Leptospira interrogans serovar Lai str. IPAV]ALE38747.1 transcriptional regulator [Leptospira interrogans serovar Hardjo 